MTAFRAIARNVVRSSFRNRTALLFTIGLAVFFMVIFGVLFGGNGPSVRVGVVDQDRSALSRSFVQQLQRTKGLEIETGSRADEQDRLQHGKVAFLAVLERGFAAAGPDHPATITAYQSSTDTAETGAIAGEVVASTAVGFAVQHHLVGTPGIVIRPPQGVATNNVRAIDFLLPSMIAYLVLQSGINFVAIGLVDQRARKVLRRFLATPLRPAQILGANIVGGALTVFIQIVVLVAVGLVVFGARTHGSWAIAALAVLCGTATFVGIGFLLTSAVRTSEAARGLAALVAFPMMFLSGIFFPIDTAPKVFQDIVHALPLTYLSDALHSVLNDGAGLRTVGVDLVVLLAWAVGCFAIATARFRWE
ncbi:MAG: ABC transporter permease [Chloroflexi bacterium]|nr:MAG: ABC transporter permease [Chloroflexota bacterium]